MEGPGAEVAAELQGVLAQACAAVQAQEEGRLQDAVQVGSRRGPRLSSLSAAGPATAAAPRLLQPPSSLAPQGFFLARSRVHYAAEALLAPLAAEAPGDGDVALAAAACALLEDTYSQAIERLTRGGPCGGGGHRAGTQLSEEEGTGGGCEDSTQLWGGGCVGLGELRGGPAARGGGGRGAVPAAAQACLREVQGSLDEVVGLAAIKQARKRVLVVFGCRQAGAVQKPCPLPERPLPVAPSTHKPILHCPGCTLRARCPLPPQLHAATPSAVLNPPAG